MTKRGCGKKRISLQARAYRKFVHLIILLFSSVLKQRGQVSVIEKDKKVRERGRGRKRVEKVKTRDNDMWRPPMRGSFFQ